MANKIRRFKSKCHVTINNSIMKERDVTLKAKGLYALVMSLPDDWDFSIKGICTITKENYTAVNAAINELIKAGYCRRERVKENGKFVGCDYEFSEVKTGSPHSGFLNVENPRVENLNDNNINSTINSPLNKIFSTINSPENENNNRESISKSRFQKPTIEQIDAYIKEKKLHFDAQDYYDYYESVGWVVGKSGKRMKDWKAACRTWENNRKVKDQGKEEKEENVILPDGMTSELWNACKAWLNSYVPRISGFITADVYMKMKERANDRQVMSDVIRYIENSGYCGDMIREFSRLIETGEYKEGE